MKRILLSLCLTAVAGLAWAEDEAAEFFQQEANVVTASKREQPLHLAPATVDVITAEDIRTSGAVDLWDVLRFCAGVQVGSLRSSTTGERAMVTIRGFPRTTVNDLQVLVDGRSVFSALRGQVLWSQIPVQLQDIERIEIVRGLDAALYGSNAALGVINIITKKPKGTQALSVEALGGTRDFRQTAEAFEHANDQFGLRVSHTYRSDNGFPRTDSLNDFTFSNKANLRAYWNSSPDTTYEFFAGGADETLGVAVNNADSHGHFPSDFEMVHISHQRPDDSSLDIMGSRQDDTSSIDPYFNGPVELQSVTYQTTGSYRFPLLDHRLENLFGLNYRFDEVASQQIFAGNPTQRNHLSQFYGQSTFDVMETVRTVVAASGESSDTTDTIPAYQAALLYSPWAAHTFRTSYSRAYSAPSLLDKYAHWQTSATRQRIGNPNVQPETFSSTELAYIGSYLHRRLQVESNLYYMSIRDRIASTSIPTGGLTQTIQTNGNAAIARGAELSLRYIAHRGHLFYANYAYESINDDKGDITVNGETPAHAVNLGGRFILGHGFSGSLNLGYRDHYNLSSASVASFSRLDARIAYSPTNSLELFVAGQNLLEEQQLDYSTSVRTPRMVEGGLSVKLGGTR